MTIAPEKPIKKSDSVLWHLISKAISNTNYVFVDHALKRLLERDITDIDVLDILENKDKRKRKRNKQKDSYSSGFSDWKYCIEGLDLDANKIRLIISFDTNLLLIITVIRI